jgi:FG-GAP-like repeat/Abnormal spindle-like microcephaly-assoc'd, ASPM-SPD-2-Hydin
MRKHAKLLGAVLLAFLSVLSYAQAPVPFINLPLIPDAAAPGGGDFTLTVNGTGFVSNSVISWNGSALATQFVSRSQLMATVPAAYIATASTTSISVANPAPGGGTSNVAFFSVTANEGSIVPFGPPYDVFSGFFCKSVAVGDFNGDGKLDLAGGVYDGTSIYLALGDGAGHFTSVPAPAVNSEPMGVAVGDFNKDGKLDLAVSSWCGLTIGYECVYPGAVTILLGDGTGNFTVASTVGVGIKPYQIAVGDFNGDGKVDLAVVNQCGADGCPGPGSVSILMGDGTGNFTLQSTVPTGNSPLSTAVGDFNGDGNLDLVVTNGFDNTVSILLGDGTGNFTLASSPVTGDFPISVAVGDFNGDGRLDLAVANQASFYNTFPSTLSIFLGDGTGNFILASSPTVGTAPASVAVGDFNGDGKLDLVVANQCGSSNGLTCLQPGSASILLGDGTGNFTLAASPALGNYPDAVGLGDFNGDGKLDVAILNDGSYTVSMLLQDIPAVTLSTSSLNFGTQLVGRTSAQAVTLTNTGGAILSITGFATSPYFHQQNNCGSSLAIGASCTINVGFKPLRIGTVAGAITITDNAYSSPQTISVTGIGSEVTLLPSSLDFGTQTVGTISPPQIVTLINHASVALNIFGVHLTGSEPGAFAQTNTCGTSVPAQGRCTISVTFAPKKSGQKTATLNVSDDGGSSPQTVTLSGTGTL